MALEAAQAQADAAARPEQVLAFTLANGAQSIGSVSAYLKQQPWWETSSKTFAALANDASPKADDIASFCRSIKDTIATLGLNAIDSGIVVAAVRERAQLSTSVVRAMAAAGDCQYATTR